MCPSLGQAPIQSVLVHSILLSVEWGSIQSSVGINACFFPEAGAFATLLKNQHVSWIRGLFTFSHRTFLSVECDSSE